MNTPQVRVKQAYQWWYLHITYADGTTQVPAYYDTEAQAQHVAATLQQRYAKAPPAATVETDVLYAMDTVRECGGHNILAVPAAQQAQREEE